jgi:type IV pilus assembly protein PilP
MSISLASSSLFPLSHALTRTALLCVLALTLSGCTDRDKRDLQLYAEEVLARKGSRIDELPPVEPYEVYTYASTDGTDPFEPFYKDRKEKIGKPEELGDGLKPDFNRNQEELEGYSLDSLRMMGTVELEQELWGIIRSPDGTIHRVQVGNYIGQNHGKIIGISEESIDLNEIVDDGTGRYQERTA